MPIAHPLLPRDIVAGLTLLVATLVTGCHRGTTGSDGTPVDVPAQRASELLAADRAWSTHASTARFPMVLAAMFADSVRMPLRDRVLQGTSAVVSALTATPDTGAVVRWVPIRVGIAADGRQGFTAGVQYLTRITGEQVTARYLAYWVRNDDGVWRVVAWRRRPLTNVTPDTSPLPPLLPERLVAQGTNAERPQHRASLIAAERGFSELANRIGVGAAFAQLGDAEALNLGRPDQPAFVRGAPAIAALVAGAQPLDAPSTIDWQADDAIVSSSGDLGITFGLIRPKGPPPNEAPAGAAFFTIWRKSSRTAAWRYVAE